MSTVIFSSRKLANPPLAADDGDPIEPVPEMMPVPVVADGAEVVVRVFSALPSEKTLWFTHLMVAKIKLLHLDSYVLACCC